MRLSYGEPYCESARMKSLIGTAALALFFAPTLLGPVWAALGDTSASVERDRVMMKGQRHSRTGTGYSIDTITVAGMQVKEYVSPDGVVFAVVWSGTGTPDLHLLLGEYFEEYREGVDAARSRRPKIRRPFQLKSERLSSSAPAIPVQHGDVPIYRLPYLPGSHQRIFNETGSGCRCCHVPSCRL